MIFGAVIDPNMGDEIRVTVIATGFERTGVPRRITPRPVTRTIDGKLINHPLESINVSAQQTNNNQPVEFKPQTFRTEDLDIPTFLRNRK